MTYNDSTANGGYETPDLAYTYTKFGQLDKVYRGSDLTALDSAELHADYEYDPVTFQVTSEELYQDTSVSRTLTRHYDDLLRPQSLVLGSDHKVGYGYDTAGRLNRVWHNPTLTAGVPQGSADFIYGYEDDSYGLIEEVAGPVHTVTNTWEGDRNVLDTKSNVKNTGNVTVSEYDYTVNDIGQRSRVDRTGSAFPVSTAPNVSWNYDSLGQVRSAGWGSAYDSNDEWYRYDSIGNRVTSFTGSEEPEDLDEYVANGVNEYTSTPFERTTSYDIDGNMTSGVVPGETGAAGTEYEDADNPDFAAATNLTWDAENRLVSITVDGVTITYDYDYLGRRISRTRSGSTFRYFYDGWNPLGLWVGSSLNRTWTWGLDLSGTLQGAGGVGGLLAAEFQTGANADTYYPLYDGNGNVCQYLDSSGNTEARYEYDSFGRIVLNAGNSVRTYFRHRFSTKQRDHHTGLYYYGYRYYDPVTGRWPSRDPIAERGGINLYGFVGNIPVYGVDFLGLEPPVRDGEGNVIPEASRISEFPRETPPRRKGTPKAPAVPQGPPPNWHNEPASLPKKIPGVSGGGVVSNAKGEGAAELGQGISSSSNEINDDLVRNDGLEKCFELFSKAKLVGTKENGCMACCSWSTLSSLDSLLMTTHNTFLVSVQLYEGKCLSQIKRPSVIGVLGSWINPHAQKMDGFDDEIGYPFSEGLPYVQEAIGKAYFVPGGGEKSFRLSLGK